MLAYRIPNFVEKCKRAGCLRVFIGLESVNAENLLLAKKRQNKVGGYRTMLMTWRAAGIMTFCGYILGFPGDSVASIERDVATIQRELPLDILEFFILTPLPGSEDHQTLHRGGVSMDSDMNKYDVEHVTTAHSQMSAEAWQDVYRRAWELYYSWAHIETLLRRAVADGIDARRLMFSIVQYRSSRRPEGPSVRGRLFPAEDPDPAPPGLPREAALLFYPRRVTETVATAGRDTRPAVAGRPHPSAGHPRGQAWTVQRSGDRLVAGGAGGGARYSGRTQTHVSRYLRGGFGAGQGNFASLRAQPPACANLHMIRGRVRPAMPSG